VDDPEACQVDSIMYHKTGEVDTWRIGLVKELLDIKHGNLILPEEWNAEELE
jgi:hypothetical protein